MVVNTRGCYSKDADGIMSQQGAEGSGSYMKDAGVGGRGRDKSRHKGSEVSVTWVYWKSKEKSSVLDSVG